ncbi:MAG: hypothetical protein EAX81_00850 [Candidatus Thorarchaeota archaeon]|nr:hypothetical protein [Candidatus Thorarchaeota archaeon]
MSTSFNTIIDDMKSSLKLARSSMLSYFLANIGLLILLVVLAVITAIPLAAAGFLIFGFNFEGFNEAAAAAWTQANPWVVGGVGLLVLIPIISFLFTFIASVYGMSKDLVANGETKAERAFSWFRHKFLTFAGAGVLLTVIIIIPPLVLWGSASILSGYSIDLLLSSILSVVTFVWVFLTVGLCAMVFPAITYGKDVQDAFKESFHLARTQFERVYGLLSGILLLFAASLGPAIAWGLILPAVPTLVHIANPLAVTIMVYTVVMMFLWILWFLPMAIISFVKVYAEMAGGQVAKQQPPPLPLV